MPPKAKAGGKASSRASTKSKAKPKKKAGGSVAASVATTNTNDQVVEEDGAGSVEVAAIQERSDLTPVAEDEPEAVALEEAEDSPVSQNAAQPEGKFLALRDSICEDEKVVVALKTPAMPATPVPNNEAVEAAKAPATPATPEGNKDNSAAISTVSPAAATPTNDRAAAMAAAAAANTAAEKEAPESPTSATPTVARGSVVTATPETPKVSTSQPSEPPQAIIPMCEAPKARFVRHGRADARHEARRRDVRAGRRAAACLRERSRVAGYPRWRFVSLGAAALARGSVGRDGGRCAAKDRVWHGYCNLAGLRAVRDLRRRRPTRLSRKEAFQEAGVAVQNRQRHRELACRGRVRRVARSQRARRTGCEP
eukprot:TRINITY_DN17665_c0_g1_i5.p1 TRINITY_DN17665_c0_g1~~TRINITY_DN17665_c0_g1_i5.p1  ORF type:complete len:368 (-),score=72.56 TRINITY_DN17665_c0_g1_i5:24-1127(-)